MIKRKNQHAQEENRYQIVEFLKKKKGTQKEASELFGISLKTVNYLEKVQRRSYYAN